MSPEQRDNEKRRFTGDRSSGAWGGVIALIFLLLLPIELVGRAFGWF